MENPAVPPAPLLAPSFSRLFATLDLMTNGRAAWNVVTSLNDGEAQNMGCEHVIGFHPGRRSVDCIVSVAQRPREAVREYRVVFDDKDSHVSGIRAFACTRV